jgi:predicted anti-sigma-YlaC factor YlaD
MNCKKTYKYICENLDEDLNSHTCLEIKEHLKDCPNCVAYLDTLKKTVLLYREYKKPVLNKAAKRRLQSYRKRTKH